MSRLLHVPEDARHFAFGGDECLYRDHLGRRVVADIEGDGSFRVERSSAPLLILRGGLVASKFAGFFEDGLVVVAESTGDVTVRTWIGGEGLCVQTDSVADTIEGAGWVVSATGDVEVDDRWEAVPIPVDGFPVPFFRSAKGNGLEIVRSDTVCTLLDQFSIDDAEGLRGRRFTVQNMSAISELTSHFGDGRAHSAPIASHLNTASWRLNLSRPVRGMIIRKTYDRFHGRQRARVLINGRFAGWWYEPSQNREARWAVSDFGVPGNLVPQGEVEISVDPPAGSPLWSVSDIQVYAVD